MQPKKIIPCLDVRNGKLTKGVASIVHYGEYTIRELKEYLHGNGVPVRMNW